MVVTILRGSLGTFPSNYRRSVQFPLLIFTNQVAEQNDVTKLYEEFEEVFVDVLTAKSEGLSFSRRMKLRPARSRLRAHKDFTQREYDAAVRIRCHPLRSQSTGIAPASRASSGRSRH
jgi:hypothetical protein